MLEVGGSSKSRIQIQIPPQIMNMGSSYFIEQISTGVMDHSELASLIFELQGLDERCKIGLTMFIEGAQGFHGNFWLLLDPYLFQENKHELYKLIEIRGLRIGFCSRAEATFVMVSS